MSSPMPNKGSGANEAISKAQSAKQSGKISSNDKIKRQRTPKRSNSIGTSAVSIPEMKPTTDPMITSTSGLPKLPFRNANADGKDRSKTQDDPNLAKSVKNAAHQTKLVWSQKGPHVTNQQSESAKLPERTNSKTAMPRKPLPPICTGDDSAQAIASYKGGKMQDLTPRSMLTWEGSFEDQSIETLETAWNEVEHIDSNTFGEVVDARPILPKVAFCIGDLRDGLAMINMQSILLMSQHFTKKENGKLLFAFGMAQVISMSPVGYIMDKTSGKQKLNLLIGSQVACSFLTVLTAIFARFRNVPTMMTINILQGIATAFQPTALNSITLGVVGAPGFTAYTARNIMMRHIGTATVVALGTLLAYFLYPTVGVLFVVSPIFCAGLVHFVRRINPEAIDSDAARGLIERSRTMESYEAADEANEALWKVLQEKRLRETGKADLRRRGKSCRGDCGIFSNTEEEETTGYVPPLEGLRTPQQTHDEQDKNEFNQMDMTLTPQQSNAGGTPELNNNLNNNTSMLPYSPTSIIEAGEKMVKQALHPFYAFYAVMNTEMLLFSSITFVFHLANSAVLPLTMSVVQLEDERSSVLLSGLCIMLAQSLMMIMSKIVGDYSPYWGRKKLLLICLFSLPVRCFILSILVAEEERVASSYGRHICKVMIVSTQILDALGTGIYSTLYVLIINDISRGTGRFSLLFGIATSFMCLGSTFSSLIGSVLAEDFGDDIAINILGLISLIPAFTCVFNMPETLPEYARPGNKRKGGRKLGDVLWRIKRTGRSLLRTKGSELFRKESQVELV